MGDPVTFKGDLLNVTVDFGNLDHASFYEQKDNSINVVNRMLLERDVGVWNVTLEAVYREKDGAIIKYSSFLWVQVIDPRKELPESPPQIP